MSSKAFEGKGSLGGRLVDVGDGVLRICTKTGEYIHDAATALAKGRGVSVKEVVTFQSKAAEKVDFCVLKYVMSVLLISPLVAASPDRYARSPLSSRYAHCVMYV